MLSKETLDKLAAQLASDSELNKLCARPPAMMEMPFKKSETEVYLAMSLSIPLQLLALSTLWQVSVSVLRTVSDQFQSVLPRLRAIELLFFVSGPNVSDRVLRLTVYEQAFLDPFLGSPQDLLKQQAKEGVTCGWYLQKEIVPEQPPT